MEKARIREVDVSATLDAVRAKHESIRAYCRHIKIHPDTFYLALRGKRGRTRKGSQSAQVMRRLEKDNLLVFTNSKVANG
jgi:hypothetical protein